MSVENVGLYLISHFSVQSDLFDVGPVRHEEVGRLLDGNGLLRTDGGDVCGGDYI